MLSVLLLRTCTANLSRRNSLTSAFSNGTARAAAGRPEKVFSKASDDVQNDTMTNCKINVAKTGEESKAKAAENEWRGRWMTSRISPSPPSHTMNCVRPVAEEEHGHGFVGYKADRKKNDDHSFVRTSSWSRDSAAKVEYAAEIAGVTREQALHQLAAK